MGETILIGDRVKVFLNQKFWKQGAWFEGIVFKIEPYSQHRSFYWVELNEEVEKITGIKRISVLNPENIEKIDRSNG